MAIDFSAFDEKVDLQELQNEVQNAPDNDFADVPDGTYIISIQKMISICLMNQSVVLFLTVQDYSSK